MGRDEAAFLDLVLEFVPGVYAEGVFLTERNGPLVDVCLYLVEEALDVIDEAFKRS